MFAIAARYLGSVPTQSDRTQVVTDSAEALSTLIAGDGFDVTHADEGVISAAVTTPEDALAVLFNLISADEWTLSLGISETADSALELATDNLDMGARPAAVSVVGGELATVILDAFELIIYVFSRRSPQGREATSLMRAGLNQVEAARELDISKQALNQRLVAAGWNAESAGWDLLLNLLQLAV
ncbi:MAG: hypothetical protein SPI77_03475 [Corynebacterium sp.]|nr:hypothetical protein [Corynebacterium sp.]